MLGEMRVLNASGDVTVTWDPDDAESTEKARAEFDRLKADGYEMYQAVETKGRKVAKFDPKVGRLIAAPGGKTKADRAGGRRPKAMAGGPVRTYSGW